MNKTIYRYKAFNDNLKSVIGTQFKISKTYEIKDNNLKMRSKRFHFCEDAYDIFKYYRHKIRKIRICKIKAENIVVKHEDKYKISIIEDINYKNKFLFNFINKPDNEKNYLGDLILC